MAYTDDAVKAKLSALNETQESIVTVAQWVMFHRRHADKTAQIWLQKIRDSQPLKRLNLIYLANEVSQQSKARGREEFLSAFAPIVAEATAVAYKGSSNDIQQKLRRVVEVWRARNVFEIPILDAVDARVNEIDKNRSTTKKQPLGGSLFNKEPSSGSAPSELQPLVPLQVALNKAAIPSITSAANADSEYNRLYDTKEPQPTPPVHAARLSQLLKSLANAESSVSEVIKSRRALIDGLEKLLATNRSELAKEETLVAQLSERKAQTDAKKREVEDAIMQNMSDDTSGPHYFGEGEVTRPEAEALTPPPVEALTPVGSPKREQQVTSHGPFTEEPQMTLPDGLVIPETGSEGALPLDSAGLSPGGNDFDLSSNGGAKRRKVAHGEEDYSQYATGDLDIDVAALIAQQGKQ
ncbi:hypothetical protein N7520_010377 [Penicillium odoratum]|uniref:uncharacterized protein n=1 Tax=Penicillium odoratum TaxID=1167516 RepID=UPI00254819D8|nr:uncharacterized protein N7520_010377 [Penicillium odoratum]KAJ5745195.1 hypothetical protein N7520_010377 [Penicillium odoratum]